MSTQTFTSAGSKATTAAKLEKSIFDVEVKNHALIKQAYIAYQANGRENHAKTLRRGEVRGGGKKPWKQKGTGRARFGSIRVPIWRGGGITFGPLGIENYSRTLTTGTKRQAVRQALSLNKENIIVVEAFESKTGKVADSVKFFDKIGAKRKILLVVDHKDEKLDQATSNLSNVVVSQAMYLNVFNIMNADCIVITSKSLEIIETWLKKEAKDTGASAAAKAKEDKKK